MQASTNFIVRIQYSERSERRKRNRGSSASLSQTRRWLFEKAFVLSNSRLLVWQSLDSAETRLRSVGVEINSTAPACPGGCSLLSCHVSGANVGIDQDSQSQCQADNKTGTFNSHAMRFHGSQQHGSHGSALVLLRVCSLMKQEGHAVFHSGKIRWCTQNWKCPRCLTSCRGRGNFSNCGHEIQCAKPEQSRKTWVACIRFSCACVANVCADSVASFKW